MVDRVAWDRLDDGIKRILFKRVHSGCETSMSHPPRSGLYDPDSP